MPYFGLNVRLLSFFRFVLDPVLDPVSDPDSDTDLNPDSNPDLKGLFWIRIRPKVSDPYATLPDGQELFTWWAGINHLMCRNYSPGVRERTQFSPIQLHTGWSLVQLKNTAHDWSTVPNNRTGLRDFLSSWTSHDTATTRKTSLKLKTFIQFFIIAIILLSK